jgi:hypothetical protein
MEHRLRAGRDPADDAPNGVIDTPSRARVSPLP